MAKLPNLPESTFEDDDQLAETPTVYVDDVPDTEFRDPEYDDKFRDPDAEEGTQEWAARKQK